MEDDARMFEMRDLVVNGIVHVDARGTLHDEFAQMQDRYRDIAVKVVTLREKQRARLREWNPEKDKVVALV